MKNWKNGKRGLTLLLALVLLFQGVGEIPMSQVLAENVEAGAAAEIVEVLEAVEETEEVERIEEVAETVEETEEVEKIEEVAETVEVTEETEEIERIEEVAETVEATEEAEAMTAQLATEQNMPVVLAAGTDYTTDAAELGIELTDFKVTKANGEPVTLLGPAMVDGASQYDASSNAFYDIQKIQFTMTMRVNKDDATRQLKAGDTFTLDIPEGVILTEQLKNGEIKAGGGTVIANYNYVTDATGKRLVFTFTDAVDFAAKKNTNIEAGLYLELDVDTKALLGKNKVLCLLGKREDNPAVTIRLPEEPNTVSGISKEGVLNISDNTITWKIRVGTDAMSKGVSLSGIELLEEIGEGQTFVRASAGENPITAEVSKDGKTVILPLKNLDIFAPAEITVVTAVTKETLESMVNSSEENTAADENILENTVTMQKTQDSPVIVEGKPDANAVVKLNVMPSIQKEGYQIDSHTIRWTIKINDTDAKVTAYRGVVTDTLAQGLTYVEGSFQCSNGKVTEKEGARPTLGIADAWTANMLYVNGQTLEFCMAELLSDSCVLTFDTKVPDDFTGSSAEGFGEGVTNQAEVAAKLPHWTTGGTQYEIPLNFGTPEIFIPFTAAKLHKSVSADGTKPYGQLTWTIEPSTRIADYDTAMITDTIQPNQRLCQDTVQIFYKNADKTQKLGAADIFTYSYNEEDRKLEFIFDKSKASDSQDYSAQLSDYKIVYQTDALTYLAENNSYMYYPNTAILLVSSETINAMNVAEATAGMSNEWLRKETAFEYDASGTPYFHYTITANGNNIQNLKNVVVSDDITKAIRFWDDADSFCADWQIDTEKTKIYKADSSSSLTPTSLTYGANNRSFECKFETLSGKVIIELYVKYTGTKEALTTGAYKDKKMYSVNTAAITSEEIQSTGTAAITVTDNSKDNAVFDNTVVQKKNEAGTNITWRILINPNSGKMGRITIYDSIAKTQKYVENSVKLYEAAFTAGDSSISNGVEKSAASLKFDVSKNDRSMTLTVDAANKPLILEYQTVLLDTSLTEVSNQVSVKEAEVEYGTSIGIWKLSGGNWGSLTSAGTIILKKVDASVGADMPLAGAEFTLYSDAEGKHVVDIGDTDKDGMVTFTGLDVDPSHTDLKQTYYYKETKAPKGYVADDGIYPLEVYKSETRTYVVSNKRETAGSENAVSRVSLQKLFYYTDISGIKKQASDKQAEFKVMFYPYGEGNQTGAREVSFTGADGVYSYSNDTSSTEKITTITNAADGSIQLCNLPWGTIASQRQKRQRALCWMERKNILKLHRMKL